MKTNIEIVHAAEILFDEETSPLFMRLNMHKKKLNPFKI